MRRPRSLSIEEVRLWRQVLQTVTPLANSVMPPTAAPVTEAPPVDVPPPKPPPNAIDPKAAPRAAPRPNGVDGQTQRQLAKGERKIEAVIDLHGMTLAVAYGALQRFVTAQAAAQRRCLLVITGKGDADRPGRLRREVPQWLAEWRPPVLAVSRAIPRHGGDGALYVLLQRQR